MSWKKWFGFGCAGSLAALAITAGLLMIWRPWVPPVELADPRPSGTRILVNSAPANYYPARGAGKHPAILVLGGSEGALGTGGAQIARALQGAGFNALQLSYFRAPGQPKDLVGIPLERFDVAINWLKGQPEVDPGRIGVVGTSKGAEAALITASRRQDIRAVVAGSPSSVVWPGLSWEHFSVSGSSWTLAGRDVPALAYGKGSYSEGMISIYANGLKALLRHPETAIPIERSPAQILLVCGKADTMWPSCLMADQLRERDPRITVIAFSDAGHFVFGIPQDGDRKRLLTKFGGTADGNNRARAASWHKALEFLNGALATNAEMTG